MSDTAAVKVQLESRRHALQQRLARVEVDQRHQDEPLEADFAEQAAQTGNDEVLGAIGDTIRSELADIDAALSRLAAGHYGQCAACGQAIEAVRLAAVPYALRCSRCA